MDSMSDSPMITATPVTASTTPNNFHHHQHHQHHRVSLSIDESKLAPVAAGSLGFERSPNSAKRSSWYATPPSGSMIMPPPSASSIQRMPSPLHSSRASSPERQSPPKQPFNFQSTVVSPTQKTFPTTKPGQRRGHRYKHSSVSINFFEEPPVRAPLAIPKSLPIPTLKEWYQSMSKDQRVRLGWCGCHFFAAFLVYTTKNVSLTALSALSHLLFYDAMGATLCVAVDVLSNFQVWKQSSIHHPFGLERIEVLVGFALSVGLIFMGGDIVSHSIQDIIQQMFYSGQHSNHDHHHHHNIEVHDVKWTSMVLRVALAILVTIISAIGLRNHNRISDMTDSSRGSVGLSLMTFNPSHLVTLTFSILILLIPFFGYFAILDTILTPLIAVSMCVVGWNLAKRLGGMLVMSYSGPDYIQEIETKIKQSVVAVDMKISDISIWQVHHDLWLGSMNMTVSSDLDEDDESLLRKTASDIIKSTMIEEVKGGSRWETTIDIKKI